jgi:hypothetical protein
MTDVSRISILCRTTLVLILGLFFLLLPHVAGAQSALSGDLSATIRAELLSDPRTASLSQAQLDAMVSLLAQKAEMQGITAADITWRPQSPVSSGAGAAPTESCAGNFTCIMDEAFGFIGPDTTIPFFLGMASMGLIWVLAEMMHRKKYPHLVAPPAPVAGM